MVTGRMVIHFQIEVKCHAGQGRPLYLPESSLAPFFFFFFGDVSPPIMKESAIRQVFLTFVL